jgi:hypothetical protein
LEPLRREWRVLDTRVIAVASQGGRGDDWAAYIGAVKGDNHAEEWKDVLDHGTKLPREVAEAIFPHWAKNYTWRY